MALSPGTWLNHYEILGPIGSGGMGEVYRARDNKLQREVALKVLPEAFARDPERVARFRREAQVLAQLNHPNIAAIYSVEQSGETHFLVMELALGETLRERIKRGRVPIEEALDIAKQIAAGLEAAHEKPIVHRDLKPANVKVTPEGVVKILDFGLARAFSGDTGSGDPADSPTLSAMTAPGVILGTAAYMSPEQARGKTVDKRTDIWALGCVLYELLTGKHAFEGEDVPEILASVMKGEPDWTALPASTPPGLRALLRRCLQKEAKNRLRDAADVQIQMQDALHAPAENSAFMPIPPIWRRALVPVLTLIVGAVIASLAAWNLKPTVPATPQTLTRFTLTLPSAEPLGAVAWHALALSPDGTHLAYAAAIGGITQLYLRAMDQQEFSLIAGTEGVTNPFFSPDGQWVGFFAEGKLKKVSVSGGAPLTLADAGNARGATWGRDDTIVFAPSSDSGLFQVSAAGGTAQSVTTLDAQRGERSHRWPEFLPDGETVLFAARLIGTDSWDDAQIVAQQLETGERRVLIDGGTHPHYVPTGHLVYLRGETLMAVSFDLARLEVTGAPVPVVEGIMESINGAGQVGFSSLGTLVYVRSEPGGARNVLVWVDRRGAVEPLAAPPRGYSRPRLSPDGQLVSVDLQGGAVSGDIWVYDIRRQTLTRLTLQPGNQFAIWTPDGKRLTFSSTRAGPRSLFWQPADGSGTTEQLTTSEHAQNPSSWSPDGKTLAFMQNHPSTSLDIWVLPLEGERPQGEAPQPRPFLRTPFYEAAAVFSPDGRWVAYVSDESGRPEVYVQPFPGPGQKWQISTEGGEEPVWSRDGRELFYRNGNQMMAVGIVAEAAFTASTPRLLFEGQFRFVALSANYDVSPDGQRFLMVKSEQGEVPTELNVVLNWFEELRRRVPAAQ